MAYIRLSDNKYPVSEQEIRDAHPLTLFATPFNPDGYAVVFPAPQPEYDQYTQSCREIAPVLTDKGHLEQQWEVTDIQLSAEELSALVDRLKSEKTKSCDLLAKSKRDALTANIAAGEMASWPIKRAEAIAYQANGQAESAPNLQIEANARQISLSDLVVKVLTKAGQLSYVEAQLAGVNGKHNDAISLLNTLDAVTAYDISAGWPV